MMQVEEKPDVTYSDVGGCKEQIEKLREVVETPSVRPLADLDCAVSSGSLIQRERFGINPPKGVLLFGPPDTGKTLCYRGMRAPPDAMECRSVASRVVQ